MRAALHDGTVVVNVIVYDPASTYDPGDLILDQLPDDSAVGPGWLVNPYRIAPVKSLLVNPATIPADGATASTATYTNTFPGAPAQVTFDVNGTPTTVAVANGIAELDVTAVAPGQIAVTCDGLTATITATGA